MEFLSIPFFCCVVITFVLYYARTGHRWQHALLLVSSMVFVGYYDFTYLLYALGITFFTFYAGKLLHKKRGARAFSEAASQIP